MEKEKSYNLAGRRVFIGLPAYDFKVSLKLAVSLAKFVKLTAEHGISVHIGSVCGCSVVSRARNLLVKDFLDTDCTDLFFIDADINFEPEDVLRLLALSDSPKKGIVAGVPRTRDTSCVYITTMYRDENGDITMNGLGMVKATRVATAFMCIRREVLETLVNTHPEWSYYDNRTDRTLNAVFDFKVTEEGYMGEDFLFCDRAREAGYEVWIDPTIKLGHMGVQEYLGDFGNDILYPMISPVPTAVPFPKVA